MTLFLIKSGADIDAQDKHGQTALMVASKLGDPEIVKMLFQLNVNITLKDKLGNNAWTYAKREYYSDVLKLLEDAGCEKIYAGNCGIFQHKSERSAAELFPVFGFGHSFEAGLNYLIKKYNFDKIKIEAIGIYRWQRNILKDLNINTLDKLLMTPHEQLNDIRQPKLLINIVQSHIRDYLDKEQIA